MYLHKAFLVSISKSHCKVGCVMQFHVDVITYNIFVIIFIISYLCNVIVKMNISFQQLLLLIQYHCLN